MKTVHGYNDAYSKAVLAAFRQALDPLLRQMNQDFQLHHMEIERRDIDFGLSEEVAIKIILRHPRDFNHDEVAPQQRQLPPL